MITSIAPENWQDLQVQTARILRECGFSVEIEKVVETARGNVELDIYAEENVEDRRYAIVCECKHWHSRVPQTVIHGFRTVLADLGANVGYIVASNGFQAGAGPAAAYTNVKLVTWEEFQAEFERTWLKRFLQATVAERCDPLLTYTEPLLPAWFRRLSDQQKDRFLSLKRQHDEFGWLMMQLTYYVRALRNVDFPDLPLRPRITKLTDETIIPDDVLDAVAYRELLEAALAHSDQVITEFRALRPQTEAPSDHE
jgi:hypothetical protein